MTDAIMHRRLQLRAHGYMPLPLFGKVPPLKEWQKLTVISRDMITLWEKVWPDAINTGCLTRTMPALDIDVRNEEAAVCEEEAQALINDAATLLTTAHGYTRTVAAPKSNGIRPGGGEALWKFHFDNICAGRDLHHSINRLAAALIRSGMDKGAAVHLLAALLELSEASHDERWEARYRDMPRAVDTAVKKYR